MRPFRLEHGATLHARFDAAERSTLVRALRRAEESTDAAAGSATQAAGASRLLPDAYPDDPEASAEFRRLTHDDVLAAARANVDAMRRSLAESGPRGQISLTREQADAWMRGLTTIRLAYAADLGIEREGDELRARTLRQLPTLAAYQWLGFVQQSLIEALDQ